MSSTASGSTAVPGFVITGILGDRGPWVAARQLGLDRTVAVKRLATEEASRFQAEIGIIGLLEHPGIVPLYDAGIDADGQPFYAMRDVHGVPWSERLGEDPTRDHEVLERLAETLAYAHHRGVAHGAVAAERVLLGRFGEVLLTGWDAASTDPVRQRDDLAALATLLARLRPGAAITPQPDAAAFLVYLAHLRAADRASAFRRDAEEAISAGDWAQARFAWQEAERADPGRNDVVLGRRIALGYAAAAAARDDLALAVAVLDPDDPDQAAMRGRLLRQQERRRHRHRTLRRLALAVGLLVAAIGLALGVSLILAERNRQRATEAAASAAARERETQASTYATGLATVARLLADHHTDLALPLLAGCPEDLRGWEWRRLRWLALAQTPELDLGQAAMVGPVTWQGGWIACRYGDAEIGLWRSAGPPERRIAMVQPLSWLAIADDGSRLWQLGNGVLTCNDLGDGSVRWSIDIGPSGRLLALPDHRVLVAMGSGNLTRIDIIGSNGHPEGMLMELPHGLHLWACDGDAVLIRDRERGLWRCPVQPDATPTTLPGRSVTSMIAIAGGLSEPLGLVSYGNGNVGLVNLEKPGRRYDWIQEMHSISHGAIAPDGSRYATIDHATHTIMMYDRARGGVPWRWHLPVLTSRLRFSPDGNALLAAGVERAFVLSFAPQPTWHAIAAMSEPTGPLLAEGRNLVLPDGRQGPEGHASAITATAVSAGRIYSGDHDGWLLVWDEARLRCLWRERIGSGPITAIVPGVPLQLRSGSETMALPSWER